MRRFVYTSLVLVALAGVAGAKTDLVTLPGRDRTELTIYNSQDLTLVKETRTLAFRKGLNQIQFSWANTKIDPTSLQIDLKNAAGLTLLDAVYPKDTNEVIEWNVEAQEPVAQAVEITYFASGLSWSSNYVVVANTEETTFDVQQFTRVANNSGEDFDRSAVRVVVGDVNLKERIDELIARWNARFPRVAGQAGAGAFGGAVRQDLFFAQDAKARGRTELGEELYLKNTDFSWNFEGAQKAKDIVKKAVSEYRLFAVEGEEDLETGWSKSLPNPKKTAVPFDLSYEYDARRYGLQVTKFYKLQNDEKHQLGKESFPEGSYYVYRTDARQGVSFEGQTQHKYVPEGEKIELNLGDDGLVRMEDKVLARQRGAFSFDGSGDLIGWDETVTRRIELRNSRSREIPFKLTHYLEDNAEVSKATPTHEQVDKETLRWELKIPAESSTTIEIQYVVHAGTNVKDN